MLDIHCQRRRLQRYLLLKLLKGGSDAWSDIGRRLRPMRGLGLARDIVFIVGVGHMGH